MSEPLPILDIIHSIREKLISHNILILQAPPGAGKSTVLPLELLNEPWLEGKKILMLEPRRLAARTVANRMSSLLSEKTGDTVGYRIRFENRVGSFTRIEVLTEGILTRMLQQDNSLEGVGMVIFDEFHERSLHADLALALCREAQQVLREDLRILIMSATLDGEKLASLLDDAPVLTSRGRQHPIRYYYTEPDAAQPLHRQVAAAIRKALASEKGDILAFLPGTAEIQRTADLLEESVAGVKIRPLYGDLSQEKQQAAILPDPSGFRKVVLATSIAETSLTIEGVSIVVDSGYSRVPRFDPRSGLTKLETVRLTLDTADQRAGRAGRLGPGVCYRLWTEASQHQLLPHRNPEILEADLTPLMLELYHWGVKDPRALIWLTPPPSGTVNQATQLLEQLDAVENGRITERGREMLRLPAHPRLAHMILEADEDKLLPLASDLISLLDERDPLPRESGANLTLRVEALRRWRSDRSFKSSHMEFIERAALQWRKLLKTREDNSMPADQEVGLLLAAAYPERIAKKTEQRGRYRLGNGRFAKLAEHDPLVQEEWLAIAHMDAGTNEGRIYLAAPLKPVDLMHLAHEKESIRWDSQKGILIAQKEVRIGDLILESRPLSFIPENYRARVLMEVVRSEGLCVLDQSEESISLQARIASLRLWRPEESWPVLSEEQLLETLEDWLPPYLGNIRRREDFRKISLLNVMMGILPWALQQRLDHLAPSKLEVPTGSLIKLQYKEDGSAPVLAVRLQEMFGLLDTPAVNEGRNPVLLHLLSPGYKPVQVTQDLRSFWKNIYPEVRRELRIRYPRHHWPEDPFTAEPMRGPKKRNL